MMDSTIGLTQVSPEMLLGTGSRLEGKVQTAQNSTGQNKKSELKKVAQEFEAIFISQLLKVMRETIDESGSTEEGFGKSTYTEMFDQELSVSLAKRGALGISDLLYQNLVKSEIQKESSDSSQAPASPQGAGIGASSRIDTQEISDLQLPVLAPVSSPFGVRVDPLSHKMRSHKGVDLAAPKGTAIASPLPGTVVSAGYENGYGNTILIQHSDGLRTRYGHLDSINVKAGEKISEQQMIGTVGDSGRSTGPHLHFEVIRMGKPVDPLRAIGPGTANLEKKRDA
jgi:murein DD-endopeptidase MepM/ murein hydrolase activator NlpD